MLYKGYEIYTDPTFYYKIAVKKENEVDSLKISYVNTTDEATRLVDKLVKKEKSNYKKIKKVKKNTSFEEEFKKAIHETIPQALFHVTPTDKDDIHGTRLDELILLRILNRNPKLLKHKPLIWFIKTFIKDE